MPSTANCAQIYKIKPHYQSQSSLSKEREDLQLAADLIIVDLPLKKLSSKEFLDQIRETPDVPIVFSRGIKILPGSQSETTLINLGDETNWGPFNKKAVNLLKQWLSEADKEDDKFSKTLQEELKRDRIKFR